MDERGWKHKAHARKPPLSILRRRRAANNTPQAAVPLLAVPALAARRLRDGDASLTRHVDNAKRRTSFIAHLSHASRQPHGTASNVTGLPHLQVVISACSALTTAVAITCGTGGQNRVVAALPPVLRSPMPLLGRWAARLSSDRAISCSESRRGFCPLERIFHPRPRHLNGGQGRPVYAC